MRWEKSYKLPFHLHEKREKIAQTASFFLGYSLKKITFAKK